jgi:hypothetical protein
MTDIESLFKAGAEGPWAIFRALADAYEEQGDYVLASGFRWMYEWKRHPNYRHGQWYWALNPRGPMFNKGTTTAYNNPVDSFHLPSEIDFYIDVGITASPDWKKVVTQAAFAIGMWRRDIKKEPKVTKPDACGVPSHDLECVACGVRLYGKKVENVCPYEPKNQGKRNE